MAIEQKILDGYTRLKDWITSTFAYKSHGTHVSASTCVTSVNGQKGAVTISTGSSGTTNYNALTNKPSINGVTLTGNKTSADIGVAAASHGTHVSTSTCVTSITVKQKDSDGNTTTLLNNAQGNVSFEFSSGGNTTVTYQTGVSSIKIGDMTSAKKDDVVLPLDEIGAVPVSTFNILKNRVDDHINDTSIHFEESTPPLFAPNFARKTAFTNYGRIENHNVGSGRGNTSIIELLYPCFLFSEFTTFAAVDSDQVLEMSTNPLYCVAHNNRKGSDGERYVAAKLRDPSYTQISLCTSQPRSALIPIGSVGYWYHLATGAIGSTDTGDSAINVSFYVVPAYGTPTGKALCKVYDAVYKAVKYPAKIGGSTELIVLEVESYTLNKTVYA